MGCEKSELNTLMDTIRYTLFEEEPKPKSIDEVRERFELIAEAIEEISVFDMRSRLGIWLSRRPAR